MYIKSPLNINLENKNFQETDIISSMLTNISVDLFSHVKDTEEVIMYPNNNIGWLYQKDVVKNYNIIDKFSNILKEYFGINLIYNYRMEQQLEPNIGSIVFNGDNHSGTVKYSKKPILDIVFMFSEAHESLPVLEKYHKISSESYIKGLEYLEEFYKEKLFDYQ